MFMAVNEWELESIIMDCQKGRSFQASQGYLICMLALQDVIILIKHPFLVT